MPSLPAALVGLGFRFKVNSLLLGPGPTGGVELLEGLSKESQPVFMRVSKKTKSGKLRTARSTRAIRV